MCFGRVSGDEHAVIIIGRAHVHTGSGAAEFIGGHAGVFECFPDQFQGDALLRIHVGGLQRGETEKFWVKAGNIIQVAALKILSVHLRAQYFISVVLRPAANGQFAGAGAAFAEHLPEFLDAIGAGETASNTNNGDIVRAGCACLLRRGALDLRRGGRLGWTVN